MIAKWLGLARLAESIQYLTFAQATDRAILDELYRRLFALTSTCNALRDRVEWLEAKVKEYERNF